jgi:DNA polymerase
LYSKAVSTAPTKYKAFLNKACDDGTVKGAHQFIGASRTGRDASRGINTQNLKRGPIDDYAPEIILKGDTDIIGALYGDVINVLATSVRAAIAAPEGKVLLISDLAGIEGRALPWLCFFTRKLDQIAGGMDMYKVAACSIYHKQYEDIDKDERFVGKVAELALGYQGAVGAFSSMAVAYGADLPEELVKRIVKEWRKSNYEIVQFWYELERMAIYTIVTGEPTTSGRIRFSLTDLFLIMHLPSGRNLYYYKPEMVVREVHGNMKDQISFMGLNTYTRKWERTFTYGGKLAENATQGLSRDIFYYGYRKAIAAGLDVRLRVHDELVCVGEPEQLPLLISCMEDLPPWAEGLPLKAEGEVTKRYKK